MIEFRQVTTGYGNTVAVKDITFSPIRGPEGNIEYLGYLSVRQGEEYSGDLSALVVASHGELKGE